MGLGKREIHHPANRKSPCYVPKMKLSAIIRHAFEFYRWPITSLRLTSSLIRALIGSFDRNRLKYMLLLFPAYQLCAIALILVTIKLILVAQDQVYWWLAFVPLTFLFLMPAIATWHLSCALFLKGYFGVFAEIGLPGTRLTVRLCEAFINEFRPSERS